MDKLERSADALLELLTSPDAVKALSNSEMHIYMSKVASEEECAEAVVSTFRMVSRLNDAFFDRLGAVGGRPLSKEARRFMCLRLQGLHWKAGDLSPENSSRFG